MYPDIYGYELYGFRIKHKIKMAGYSAKVFLHVYGLRQGRGPIKLAKKERDQYPAILTEQAWSIEDLLIAFKEIFSCQTHQVVLSRYISTILLLMQPFTVQDFIHLNQLRSQHKTNFNNITLASLGYSGLISLFQGCADPRPSAEFPIILFSELDYNNGSDDGNPYYTCLKEGEFHVWGRTITDQKREFLYRSLIVMPGRKLTFKGNYCNSLE